MEWKFISWLAASYYLLILLGGESNNKVEGFIGMEWGRYSSQSLLPSMVVDLLLQNGVSEIRLSAPSPNVMEALANANLGVTVALGNDFVKRMKWSNIQTIDDWIKELLVKPVKMGVRIKTLAILEQPFTLRRGPVWNLTRVFKETVISLEKNNLTQIKPTTAHFTDVLKNVSKPSESDFRDDVRDEMHKFLSLLNDRNSFFLYDLYPIFSAMVNDWPIEFAFMDNNSSFTIVDGKYTYTNAFEFMFDALVVALGKAGYPDMEIVIGEIGWPTDGGKYATPEIAERFFRGLLRHIKEKKGTPRRPNKNIDVYLAELTDQNKFVPLMGPISRHRGIYNFDGKPKFKIDFTGKGRDIYPTTAKGTVGMPKRWCKFNGDTNNKTKVEEQREFACTFSDCTALSPDSTCSDLNHTMNVSYSFNMFYQAMNQDLEKNKACDFDGLGELTLLDPSVGTCKFPVEILTAETVDGGIQRLNYVGYNSRGDQLNLCYTTQIVLPICVMFLIIFLDSNPYLALLVTKLWASV